MHLWNLVPYAAVSVLFFKFLSVLSIFKIFRFLKRVLPDR